jgi:hypothetical protein
MKDSKDMRLIIGITWLISFLVMWATFAAFIPKKEFKAQLIQIEQSVSNNDWIEAKRSMEKLNRVYESNRTLIQANNATEILTTFDLTLGQLEASIKHEQDAALEYIGGLESSMDFVMKAFSGP